MIAGRATIESQRMENRFGNVILIARDMPENAFNPIARKIHADAGRLRAAVHPRAQLNARQASLAGAAVGAVSLALRLPWQLSSPAARPAGGGGALAAGAEAV
jgi:hypothetical protein